VAEFEIYQPTQMLNKNIKANDKTHSQKLRLELELQMTARRSRSGAICPPT